MTRISIIIPSYNEEKYIGRTLRSIRKQGYRDIEVILADGNSSDHTRDIARREYGTIRIVVEKERNAPKAYNKAARIARGDVLLFIDADTSVSSGLLKAYDRSFDGSIVAATGPILPLERCTASMRLGFQITSVYIVRLLMALGRPAIIGSNFAAARSAFVSSGGFNESLLTYYDWDLSHRLGKLGKIVFVVDAIAYTSIRRVRKWGSLRYFAYHASNALLYAVKHKARDDYEAIR
jgi:glycosyltransferase involved in cell wall biosynthesis